MRWIAETTTAYSNRQQPIESTRSDRSFRLVSAGVVYSSRIITRTISPSDSLIEVKVSRLYLHALVGRTRSTRQMSNSDLAPLTHTYSSTDLIMAQREAPVYVRQVLHDREVLADSVVGAVALGRGAKPRCSAQSVQSTIP